MDVTLLLPWFPVMLGVGLGGRLLDRPRGLALGVVGALFWIAVVQAPVGLAVWLVPLKAISILAGAAAIVAMGAWAGECGLRFSAASSDGTAPASTDQAPQARPDSLAPVAASALVNLADYLTRLEDWLEQYRYDKDPWPKFDEFIRSSLYQTCRATHVKPYRIVEESDELVPLRELEPLAEKTGPALRGGIIGHVVTSGRAYVAGDTRQGNLVQQLAADSGNTVAWGFPISHQGRRVGVVVVGQLDLAPDINRPLLDTVQHLTQQAWGRLREVCSGRTATQHDPVSGALTREAFFTAAESSLAASYAQNEPVACAVIAIEGLRQLYDTGRWELADELVKTVAGLLNRKVRLDDELGRFDGSRFILLLRRVDSGLATLIIDQLMFRLRAVCEDNPRWQVPIQVRCGVVGSGVHQPELRRLLSEALQQAHQARAEHTTIASDLLPESLAGSAASTAEATPK